MNFRCVLLLGLFLIFSAYNPVCAQDSYLDSLEKALARMPASKSARPDTHRIKLMNEIILACKSTGAHQKGHRYADAIVLAYADSNSRTHRDSFFLGEAYAYKGILYARQGLYDSAIYMNDVALKIFEASHDNYGISMVYGNLSTVYMGKSDYPKSLEYIFKAYSIREAMHDRKSVASMSGNIAEVYRYLGDTARAMQYQRISYHVSDSLSKIHPEQKDLIQFKANALNNIGLIYDDRMMFREAIPYHLKALALRESIGDRGNIAGSLNNIAMDFKDLGQPDSALHYLKRSFALKSEIGDLKGMAICYLNMSDVYRDLKQFAPAKNMLDSALKYCRMIKSARFEVAIYKSYSDYYTDINQPALAFDWYKKYIHVRDSLESEENSRAALRAEMDFTYARKAAEDSLKIAAQQELDKLANDEAIRRQKLYTFGGVIGFVLAVIVALVSFRAFRQKQAANLLISEQKAIVEVKQKEILDSINYAKRIQLTLLAHDTLLRENLDEHFVLFMPKDIVSGDFYWATQTADSFYLAVCDSTGHGVPGAFMSLLNISFLNEAINEKEIAEPHEILNHVRHRLINSVSKEGAQDGMDGTLLRIENGTGKITYASAWNTPLIIGSAGVIALPTDKMPVGKGPREQSFSLHEAIPAPCSMLYLYTDGYADQFGGPKGKKFKYAQLNSLLAEISQLKVDEQKSHLLQVFKDWRGGLEQVDDVCLIGIRL